MNEQNAKAKEVLTREDVDRLANGKREEITSFVIPDGVTSIGEHAFDDCTSLTAISIPVGVTSLEDGAFHGCCSLLNVSMPEGLTRIGAFAFHGCSSLARVVFPGSVTSIEDNAFMYCRGLKTVEFLDGGTEPLVIHDNAFEKCTALSEIKFPDHLRVLGAGAFAKCVSLTSVRLPSAFEKAGIGAFYACVAMRRVECLSPGAEWMDYAFWGCEKLEMLSFSENCSFGKQVFGNCSGIKRTGGESPALADALADIPILEKKHTRLLEPRHSDYYSGIHGQGRIKPPGYLEMACYDDAAAAAIDCEYYYFDIGNLDAANYVEDHYFDSDEDKEQFLSQLERLNAGKTDYFINFIYFPNGSYQRENGSFCRVRASLPEGKTLFQIKNEWGMSSYYAVLYVREKRPLMPDVLCDWMGRLSPVLFDDHCGYQIPPNILERERTAEELNDWAL